MVIMTSPLRIHPRGFQNAFNHVYRLWGHVARYVDAFALPAGGASCQLFLTTWTTLAWRALILEFIPRH
jgi:hypothetical protein